MRPRATTLVGGVGVVLGSLYAAVLSATDVLPLSSDLLYTSVPGLELLSAAVVAIAFGVLAFGLPGEHGISGASGPGQAALFVFGVHPLVLDLSALLSTSYEQPAATIEGYVSLTVTAVGLAAGTVAAVTVARAGVLLGYARWALVPVVVAMAVTTAMQLVPVQEVLAASLPVSVIGVLALVAAGVAYALHGRGRDIRSLLARIEAKW